MNGVVVISPSEAINRAEEMKKIANTLNDLFKTVSARINEVDNVETGMYQGRRNPAQLKEELKGFEATFSLAYEQIIKSANDIINLARISENQ